MFGGLITLILTEVTGVGSCLGSPPAAYKHLYNEALKNTKTPDTRYLVPGLDKWWACSTGLTTCLLILVFNDTKDYCMLVQLVPRVFYHPANMLKDEFDKHRTCFR